MTFKSLKCGHDVVKYLHGGGRQDSSSQGGDRVACIPFCLVRSGEPIKKRLSMKTLTTFSLLLFFSFSVAADIGLTAGTDKLAYDCRDKINLSMSLSGLTKQNNRIMVRWISPSGRTQDATYFRIKNYGGHSSAKAWLELSAAKGAGVFRYIDPAAGFSDFIGEWKAEVDVNGDTLGEVSFVVQC